MLNPMLSHTAVTSPMCPGCAMTLLLCRAYSINHQVLAHHIHHIFFPMSQKVDTTSNPVIGEDVNAPALLWSNGEIQFMDSNPSPVLAWPHAIHSWCRPVSRKTDIILTDCYANNFSVTSFCHQDSFWASSFGRIIGTCTKIIMSASS